MSVHPSLATSSTTPGRRTSAGRAFTLVELTVVVAVLAIVAAIAAPRYGGAIARYHAQNAARRIATDLELCRQLAVATSAARTVTFDATLGTYQVESARSLEGGSAPYVVGLAKEPYQVSIVAVDFDADAKLVFDGWGAPDSGGSVTVRSGPDARTVTVDAATGAVSVSVADVK